MRKKPPMDHGLPTKGLWRWRRLGLPKLTTLQQLRTSSIKNRVFFWKDEMVSLPAGHWKGNEKGSSWSCNFGPKSPQLPMSLRCAILPMWLNENYIIDVSVFSNMYCIASSIIPICPSRFSMDTVWMLTNVSPWGTSASSSRQLKDALDVACHVSEKLEGFHCTVSLKLNLTNVYQNVGI